MNIEKPTNDQLPNKSRRDFLKKAAILGVASLTTNPAEILQAAESDTEKIDEKIKVVAENMNTIMDNYSYSSGTREQKFHEMLSELLRQCSDDLPEVATLVQQYINREISWDEFIQPMSTLFAEHGYFFNAHNKDLGGQMFIPAEHQEVAVNENENQGLYKIFGREKTQNQGIFVIHDNNFVAQGTTLGGVPVVNENGEAAKRRLELFFSSLPNTELWSSFEETNYAKTTVNNEMAHAILYNEYDFSPQDKQDWSDFETEGNIRIKNSQQAHEFISDAAALNTDPRSFAKNIFNTFIKIVTNTKGVSADYEFSENFSLNLIKRIYEQKNLNFEEVLSELEELKEAYRNRNFSRNQLRSLLERVLSNINDEDLQQIQDEYLATSKKIIEKIESSK